METLIDEVREEFHIPKPDENLTIKMPEGRGHTAPYLYTVDPIYVTPINHADYNEMVKSDFVKQSTVMATYVVDIGNLIQFLDEGMYGYYENNEYTAERIVGMVIENYPIMSIPLGLQGVDKMTLDCYNIALSEISARLVKIGVYNHIPEYTISGNYLIIRVPAILIHSTGG